MLRMNSKLEQLRIWLQQHRISVVPLLLTFVAGGVLGYGSGNIQLWQKVKQVEQENLVIQQQLTDSQRQLEDTSRKLDFVTADLAVEKNTNQLLQDDIKKQQQQVFDLKNQLAVFQKIVAPEQDSGSLVIDKFSLRKGKKPGSFHYRLVVIEQNKQKKQTKAKLQLTLTADKQLKKRKQTVTLDVLKLANTAKKQSNLTIKSLVTLEGDFVLPANHNAKALEITLTSNSGQGQSPISLSKKISWNGATEIVE